MMTEMGDPKDGEQNGSFEVRNIQINEGLDDSLEYQVVDSSGNQSDTQQINLETDGYAFAPKVGTPEEDDVLTADDGVKTMLSGLGGNDDLTGSTASDVFYGGSGSDSMTGGGGRDTFVWSKDDLNGLVQADTIDDFQLLDSTSEGTLSNADVLDLEDLVDDVNNLSIDITSDGTVVTVTDSGMDEFSIVITNLKTAEWKAVFTQANQESTVFRKVTL